MVKDKGFLLETGGLKLPKTLSKGQKRFLTRFDGFMSLFVLNLHRFVLYFMIIAVIVAVVYCIIIK